MRKTVERLRNNKIKSYPLLLVFLPPYKGLGSPAFTWGIFFAVFSFIIVAASRFTAISLINFLGGAMAWLVCGSVCVWGGVAYCILDFKLSRSFWVTPDLATFAPDRMQAGYMAHMWPRHIGAYTAAFFALLLPAFVSLPLLPFINRRNFQTTAFG